LIKPDVCHESNYYRGGTKIGDLKLYDQYGYVDSGSSSGTSANPFYSMSPLPPSLPLLTCPTSAYTIADESEIYEETGLDNPSLPLADMLSRMQLNRAIIAIAPSSSSSSSTAQEAANLRTYFLDQTSQSYADSIVLFKSKSDMDNYMTSKSYDDEDYKQGKVALGILLYEADVANKQWDYAIRANYTYDYEANDIDTVDCLYGGGGVNSSSKLSCDYLYSIPSTQYYTEDLFKPQSTSFLYGYTYSGFSTLQLMIDK
jgi:hypothetical protein